MASIQSARILRPGSMPTTCQTGRAFLTPPTHCARHVPAQSWFSTSPIRAKKDNNRNRGLSAIRGTGLRPRQTLSVKQKDFENQQLPKPVKIETQVTGTVDHGLWGFFKERQLLQTPLSESRHGRAWTVGELRSRDWDSLHQLWWLCVKERNRLATEKLERARIKAGYGDHETKKRDETVQETMKAVLDTLAERHQAYQEAVELAKNDPSIDLSRVDGPQYTQPAPYDIFEADEEAPSNTQPELPARQSSPT